MNEEPSTALYDVCQEILRLEKANQELETINQMLVAALEMVNQGMKEFIRTHEKCQPRTNDEGPL